VLSRRDPITHRKISEIAGPDELLGLKVVTERLSIPELAREHNLPSRRLYYLLSRLDRRGILKAPNTLLRRDPAVFGANVDDYWLTATSFEILLQVTNTCNLHCRHCYDRSRSVDMTVEQAAHVLGELEKFCERHWAQPHISITGGNPFLHRGFQEIYQEAARRGLEIPICGNPVSRDQLEAICRIQPPNVYQVSLEGRRVHNDWIRGAGSYDRAMEFLGVLRETHVDSCVMLTATAQNLGEILPLAALLEGRTNGFSFSRLARSGEGAALEQPEPGRYRAFLKRYVDQAARSPVSTLKENLINLILSEGGHDPSDGCTGVGCGAAFNFLAVLPDGRVYACRKFPSLVGNIYEQSLEEIYYSPEAAQYRRGMRACNGCPIRHACGGCMAAAQRSADGVSAAFDRFCWRLSEGELRSHHSSAPAA
jgi:selenobiotic family peptide radical SAM maturase